MLGRHLGFWALEAKCSIFSSGNMSNIHKYIITDMKMRETLSRRGGAAMLDLHPALIV